MLNKKLVLGSLAGATLLVGAMVLAPSSADAAVVGACVGCHTMHDSQGGSADLGAAGQQDMLLLYGCTGCHAEAGAGNDANGLGTGAVPAPQVDVDAAATANAGGYFSNVDANSHTLIATELGQPAPSLTQGPGGTFAVGAFTCSSCHGEAGHHTAAGSYRMLQSSPTSVTVTGTGDAAFGNQGGVSTYDATSMNAFCADCHGTFHGAGQGTNTFTGDTTGTWVRHPTDVTTAGYGPAFGGDAVVPVGTGQMVMCISCHRPHGSGVADLLRFSYSATVNAAGPDGADVGCESCHGAK